LSWLLGGIDISRRVGAFTLISLGSFMTQRRVAPKVMRPLVQEQVFRAGIRVLPIVLFLGAALGLVIVGQTVLLLVQVGQRDLVGPMMVTVMVRELAPLTAALVVLARVGTATVTELGTARAMGEVEALEVLGIDPVHYLVVPRLVGFSVATVSLTAYIAAVSMVSGYVSAFLRGLPMTPGEFIWAVVSAFSWLDFPLLGLKALGFGVLTSMVICHHGLAQPLRIEEVGQVTTRTVAHALVGCLVLDGLFLPFYLTL
jgi:phospholipid/cholesterol/gamma-HCH transport system permease protein